MRRNYDDQVESRTVCIVRLEGMFEVRNTMLRQGRNRHEREDKIIDNAVFQEEDAHYHYRGPGDA